MKKLLFITLPCLLFSLTATAQIGIKGGINLGATYGSSEVYEGDDIESVDPAIGYQFGLTTTLVDRGTFKVNAELLFEDRRGKKNINFGVVPAENVSVQTDVVFKNSFKYLSLPLLAAFGSEQFQFYVGPSFSYLLSGTSKVTTTRTVLPEQASGQNGLPVSGTEEVDLNFIEDYEDSYINRFNVAANLGLMFAVAPNLNIDIRAYHTLTDITNNDEDRSIIDRAFGLPDARLRDDYDNTVGLQANVVYLF